LPFIISEIDNYLQQAKLESVQENGIVITGSSCIWFWQPDIHQIKINSIIDLELVAVFAVKLNLFHES
jgi:hypothetical protein